MSSKMDADDSWEAPWVTLHVLCKEEKTVGRHRAGLGTHLAPVKAEAEENDSGVWGLEADLLGYEFL